uniref:Uncharacterized protein n=1 Tax=Kalanchoe fedtschenkoi TaxID=63787 RepID=A0A7N0UPE0_KALFE
MARLAHLLLLLCLLPSLALAFRPFSNPLIVQGRVYCDTCRAGFETPATTYITGAKVRLECRDRRSMDLRYTIDARTDATGTYRVAVNEDHGDEVCEAVLIGSPAPDCASAAPGHDRARVILTRYNGMASDDRFVNSLGFMADEALAGCDEVLQQYNETEE